MTIGALVIEVRATWWVPVYIRTLVWMCMLLGTEPDEAKTVAFLKKYAFSFRVEGTRKWRRL